MKLDFEEIRRKIREDMPRRAAHVFGCEETAAKLALRWGEDEEKARTAALFHDITKYYSLAQQLNLAEKYCIMEGKDFVSFEPVAHAFTAGELARHEYGLGDEISDAIRWHTTGRAGMTMLEKIIYLADMIEPSRDFEGVEALRCEAFEDIDRAMIDALAGTIKFTVQKKHSIYPVSVEAYNYFLSKKQSV